MNDILNKFFEWLLNGVCVYKENAKKLFPDQL